MKELSSSSDRVDTNSAQEATGRECKELREALELTQVAVAAQIGVAQATLSLFERGKNRTLRRTAFQKLMVLMDEWRVRAKIVRLDTGWEGAAEANNPYQEQRPVEAVTATESKLNPVVQEALEKPLVKFLGSVEKARSLIADRSREELFDLFVVAQTLSRE